MGKLRKITRAAAGRALYGRVQKVLREGGTRRTGEEAGRQRERKRVRGGARAMAGEGAERECGREWGGSLRTLLSSAFFYVLETGHWACYTASMKMIFSNTAHDAYHRVLDDLNPTAPRFSVSATKGEGMEAWATWLAHQIEMARA